MAELGVVNPAHDPVFVNEDARRKRDIFSGTAAPMADVELVDELAVLVGEKGEIGPDLPAESFRDRRRIDADSENPRVGIRDPLLKFLELPELTRAERSPRAPVEEVERCFTVEPLEAFRVEGPAAGILERKAWKRLAELQARLSARESRTDADVPCKAGKRHELDEEENPMNDVWPRQHGSKADGRARPDERELLERIAAIFAVPQRPLEENAAQKEESDACESQHVVGRLSVPSY